MRSSGQLSDSSETKTKPARWGSAELDKINQDHSFGGSHTKGLNKFSTVGFTYAYINKDVNFN